MIMIKAKYLLFPGHVISKNDGQEHFITASQLAHCYDISIRECITYREELRPNPRERDDLIWLFPDWSGRYEVL